MTSDAPQTDGTPAGIERRLATILSCDVAGYSLMMGENEERTIQTFRSHRAVFDALLLQHRGRIFNTAGDSVLAEFPSAVEAVRCATEIQSALQTRNEQLPADQRILFRMGINVGDVIVQNGDLLGDGVNVAARIQTAAEPGGVCISGSVYDQIQNKLSLQFKLLGDQHYKNIGKAVRTFTITHGEAGSLPVPPSHALVKTVLPGIAGVVVLCALVGGGFWVYHWNELRNTERSSLTAQLAAEKRAAEESRSAAEEQAKRTAEANAKAAQAPDTAPLATHKATPQAAEHAPVQAPATARLDRANGAAITGTPKAEKQASATSGGKSAAALATNAGKQFDGTYAGQLCNFPANPAKKVCWTVPLTVQNNIITGSWPGRRTGKPAFIHATIEPPASVVATIDGWNAKAEIPATASLVGIAGDNRIDIRGHWANGAPVSGYWTRTP